MQNAAKQNSVMRIADADPEYFPPDYDESIDSYPGAEDDTLLRRQLNEMEWSGKPERKKGAPRCPVKEVA